jgi:hypothetical protein
VDLDTGTVNYTTWDVRMDVQYLPRLRIELGAVDAHASTPNFSGLRHVAAAGCNCKSVSLSLRTAVVHR